MKQGFVEDVKGPLGLSILFEPSEPLVEVVFVHGLKGGSRKTWSKSEDMYHYWPKEWLPRDPEFKNVRIHTFGYNADWGETRQSFLSIHDFGKALLGAIHDSPQIRGGGDTPLILVGHSMGGLVIKKSYILARQDGAFQHLARRFYSMIFLATPHRGSDSAQLLGNILRASVPHGSKPYLGDLERGSGTLQSINDDFRHYSDDLQLRSFYETLKTSIGATSVLIVDKASATLGYQNEKSALVNASHRGICKFDSPRDPNFVIVRNALVSCVQDVTEHRFNSKHEEYRSQMRSLEIFLGVSEKPEDDLATLEEARFDGSCLWFTSKQSFQDWRDNDQETARIFWLSGKPAMGKSVLAGNVVDELEDLNLDSSYYFFHHNDTTKSTLHSCLRSIALQMAISNVKVRRKLLALRADNLQIDKTDERSLWRKIFLNGIFQIERSARPHYWVIDALDECNNHALLFPMLSKLETPFPLKVFITSRFSSDFKRHFALLGPTVLPEQISADDTLHDIALYVEKQVSMLPLDQDFRRKVVATVVEKSSGCFLWVVLVLEELGKVYTEADIEQVLEEVPPDMDDLYKRALDLMSSTVRNKELVRAILTWVMCAARPMNTTELAQALKLDLGFTVHALESSIMSDCGQLIYIDKSNRAQIVHKTIRDFLFNPNLESEFAVTKAAGHGRLAETCLRYMTSEDMRPPRNYQLTKVLTRLTKRSTFLDYACVSFSEHIRRVHSAEDKFLVLLDGFLKNNVLSWIEYLATTGKLHHITWTAKDLKGFLEARAKYQSPIGKQVQRVDAWATDLIRLVAKFGKRLVHLPSTIYWLIPPFCPPDSAIASQFGSSPRGISVLGMTNKGWDDRLSCISYRNEQATAVAYSDNEFAVSLSDKTIVVYNNATLQETKCFQNKEVAKILVFSNTGQLLACSSRKHVRIWHLTSCDILFLFQVQQEPLALTFDVKDVTLMAITRGNETASWNIAKGSTITPRIRQNSFVEDDSRYRTDLVAASFSLELGMLGIVYRGRPICLYDLDHDVFLGTCSKDLNVNDENRGFDETKVTPAIGLIFNPKSEISLLAATYLDGDLALFDPCELSLITIVEAGAQTLACSPDGRTLATGDSIGNIQLFEFESLRLMYRIRADEYEIRSIAFSHDGLRFCDARGPQCNIWEPSVLVRTELGETDSVSDMIPSPARTVEFIEQDDVVDITSFVCHPIEPFVFCGKDDGSVCAFSTITAKRTQVLYNHARGVLISAITWIGQSRTLISSDASGRITARKLNKGTQDWEISEPLLDMYLDHSVNQFILEPNADYLTMTSAQPGNIGQGSSKSLVQEQQQASRLRVQTLLTSSPSISPYNHSLHPVFADLTTIKQSYVKYIIGNIGTNTTFLDHDLWVCSKNFNKPKGQYSRHFFIPDDWFNTSQRLLVQVTSQGDFVLAIKDSILVIKRGLRYEEIVSDE